MSVLCTGAPSASDSLTLGDRTCCHLLFQATNSLTLANVVCSFLFDRADSVASSSGGSAPDFAEYFGMLTLMSRGGVEEKLGAESDIAEACWRRRHFVVRSCSR